MTSRNGISKAWGDGYKAGKDGESRSSNPYIGQTSVLAKSWDEGWQEGANK